MFEPREFLHVHKVGNALHNIEEGNSLDNVWWKKIINVVGLPLQNGGCKCITR